MSDSITKIMPEGNPGCAENAQAIVGRKNGQSNLTIDTRGRLYVKEYAEYFTEGGFLTHSLCGKSLTFWPTKDWEAVRVELSAMSLLDPHADKVKRHIYSGEYLDAPDNQSRILISKELREYASLVSDIVLLALGNKIEIWSEKAWETYQGSDLKAEDILAAYDSAITRVSA
jgi:MraZ protein